MGSFFPPELTKCCTLEADSLRNKSGCLAEISCRFQSIKPVFFGGYFIFVTCTYKKQSGKLT